MQIQWNYIFLIITLLISLLFALIFASNEQFKEEVLDFFISIENLPILLNFTLFFSLGTLINITGLPIAYFEFLLGFSIRIASFDYLIYPMILSAIIKAFCTFLTYFLAKFCLKKSILKHFRKKSFFKGMKSFLKEKEIIHLLYIRLLFIPLYMKNYLLPIFEVNPIVYFIVSIGVDVISGLWMVFLGFGMNNLKDFEGDLIEKIIFWMFFAVSLAIFVYIAIFTRRKMKEFEQNDKEKKKLLEIESNLVLINDLT